MTLQEKFKQWLDTDPRVQIRDIQLEVMAEEFAIGFAEWVECSKTYYTPMKELLEIYKKTL